MELERFEQLVARLERESEHAPRRYRAKVAALVLLGFGILGLLLGAVGFGLLLIAGFAALVAFSGGTALLLLLKFGKVLVLLAWPLWLLVRHGVAALFVRLPAPSGRALSRDEAPALFDALDDMRRRMKGPRFHRVLLVDEVNAAIVQRPAFGLVGWPRNHLLLGLPLLEAMPAEEALAVVAHEYGHLAGSHGHFSAFVYRLRHTWGTVQGFSAHVQGWLGRLVLPMVRWYVPYFNAYTFVLARSDEYQADAASAELVGAGHAAHALKRVNLIGPRHRRFMTQTFERVAHDALPPPDLAQRWASTAADAPAEGDATRWLADALDRRGEATDTHPTLRARLAALPPTGEALESAPPPLAGASAAERWLGERLPALRAEFASTWAAQTQDAWAERHAEACRRRERLAALRAQPSREAGEEIELLQLALGLEPETDWRDALAAFNAAHAEHPLGLYLEGAARLDRGEAAGLALLERAMAIDPEATLPACERAHAFHAERRETEAAEAWAERWRVRRALEAQRAWQLEHVDAGDALEPHGLDAAALQAVHDQLNAAARRDVKSLFLARRVIAADASAQQWLVGVELTWWGRRRGREAVVLQRLAALEWPVPLRLIVLGRAQRPLHQRFEALAGARLA